MKKLSLTCLALAAVVGFAQSAKAAPANFQLTLSSDTNVILFVNALSGTITASVPFGLTGTIDAEITDGLTNETSNDSTSLALVGADIDIADVSISLPAGFLGGVDAEITGAGINTLTTNGGVALNSTNGANAWTYTFDPGAGSPTTLEIDEGLFTYLGTGPVGGVLGSGTLDFNADPLSADIPSLGQVGTVTQNAVVSDGYVYVTISAPLTFADEVLTDPVSVAVDLSGALVATGMYPIPEPSTVVLLGIAMVGLIPVWRRIRK